MPALGIVFRLPSRTALVHYVDCHWYRRATPRDIPLTTGAKVRTCSWCRPTEADIRNGPPEVSWYAFGHTPGARVVEMKIDMEFAEKLAARRSLGWGKTPARREGWAS